MPHAALSAALARTRLTVAPPPAETDGELLRRFVRDRDDASFASLVRRLGPMVLGVCRRVAGDSHLADDAFQAAFLVLARRAADAQPREAVRGWLYGVAGRTAREARTVSARRRARECPVSVLPERGADSPEPPDADALRCLDEEVAALPDHMRTAVVLCELDGLSRKDAAERLGVAEGTLSSRLAKARKVLAERLKARGVAVPAVGLGLLLAASPVSAGLFVKTSALLGAEPSVAVVVLAKGAFRAMYFQKLTLYCVAALAVAATLAALSAAVPVAARESHKQLAPVGHAAPIPNPGLPRPDVCAPVAYKDVMLVLASKDGVAAVIFDAAEKEMEPLSYKFRYESNDGKVTKSGAGKLFERRTDDGKGPYDPAGFTLVAGGIKLEWSKGGADRGWVYYAPEIVTVHIAHIDSFEGGKVLLELPDGKKVESKKLDLKRFARK